MEISAVILAGGQAKRMDGRDKALLRVEGRPIIERTLEVLRGIFSELLIVTNEAGSYEYPGVIMRRDKISGAGPLGGIYTGLSEISNEAALVIACDMPFLNTAVIAKITQAFQDSDCEVLVPRLAGKIEPLCGVYRKSAALKIKKYLGGANDRSIRGFLKESKCVYLELEDDAANRQVFVNVNTPEDFRKLAQA